MKAIEILSENKQIAEGPASMLGQAAKRIGAAALSAAGLKTWAGQLDSKADVGQFANRYYKEYQRYLRTAGRPESEATLGDLKDFMLKNGIPTQNIPPNLTGSADKDSVFAILNKTAQEYIKGSGGAGGAVNATAGTAGSNTAAQTAPQSTQPNQAQQSTPGAQAPNTQTPTNPSNQPFSIPALLQVIPQMNKKDLKKIVSAAQTALQNPAAASRTAATTTAPVNTSNMTPAQIRATKQAQAANAAQAQMRANPAPASASAPTPAPTPQSIAQTRAAKQKAAAATAQAQMANPGGFNPPAPKPQSSVKVSAPRRGRKKVAVAV
jgi:hypothetical protein